MQYYFGCLSIVSHAQSWTYMDARIWGSSALDVVDNKLYLCGIDTVILGATSINKSSLVFMMELVMILRLVFLIKVRLNTVAKV